MYQIDPRDINQLLKYVIIKLLSIKATAWKHSKAHHFTIMKSNKKKCSWYSKKNQKHHQIIAFYFKLYCIIACFFEKILVYEKRVYCRQAGIHIAEHCQFTTLKSEFYNSTSYGIKPLCKEILYLCSIF